MKCLVVSGVLLMLGGCAKNERYPGEAVNDVKVMAKKYAYEAYGQWTQVHPGTQCPANIEDLSEFMNSSDTRDRWGNKLQLLCGAGAPAGVTKGAVGILSLGPDGEKGTDDDIKSWE